MWDSKPQLGPLPGRVIIMIIIIIIIMIIIITIAIIIITLEQNSITVIIIVLRIAVHHLWRYERSSRLIRNLSNCEREAWKKFRDSNPWPLRYRCSALPTELWSHNCWEQVNFSGSIMPLRVIQHYSDWVCTAVMSNDVMKDLRESTSYESTWKYIIYDNICEITIILADVVTMMIRKITLIIMKKELFTA